MEATIKIQDIDSSYLAELTDKEMLQVICGAGAGRDTGVVFDIAYGLGRATRFWHDHNRRLAIKGIKLLLT